MNSILRIIEQLRNKRLNRSYTTRITVLRLLLNNQMNRSLKYLDKTIITHTMRNVLLPYEVM